MKSLLKNAIVYCIVISAHINIGAQTVADNPIVRTALDELEEALLEAGGNESFMKDFYLTLCNSEEEPLQDIPFVIIYKPVFPEN